MTTQPRPAGWYPDPSGRGGQKYWDGGDWEQQDPESSLAAVDHSSEQSPLGSLTSRGALAELPSGDACEVPTPKR
jgi:hypothetical protein